MDFAFVSSMIVQKLVPEKTKTEVSSTVADSPPPTSEKELPKLPPQPPMLPPCRVCGEKASGFHYGANTCEACKGFFRRSLQRKGEYRCTGRRGAGDCQIGPGKRNTCAYCRYRKCINIGMSKTAIKTGRYTHEKKTRDIQEVKQLKKEEELSKNGRLSYYPIQHSTTSPEYNKKLEDIIKHITSVHLQQTPHTPEFFEKLPGKEKEFLEQREIQREVFGPLKPISKDEYMKIYQSTGIDIDGRRELIKHMIPCIEKAIKRFICFAKSLPGFRELPISDQISLIKASKSDVWLMITHRCFNVKHKLFTPMHSPTTCLEDLSRIHNIKYLEKTFMIAERLQEMDLSVEETVVMASFAVLFPDRCELERPDKVEESQWLMLYALKYLFKKNHPDKPHLFAKAIAVITEMRSLEHLRKKEEEKFVLDWSDKIELPQLVYEVWST